MIMVFADIRRLSLASIFACGCSPSIDEMGPRGVAERVVAAMNDADIPLFFNALPSEAALARALRCSPNHSLSNALRRVQEEAPATLPLWREAGVYTKIIRFDEKNAEVEILSPGETVRNCTVLEPMEIKRIDITFINRRGGRREETRERWPFWRFDGDPHWYYTRF